ncbi:MAG TPA: FGGY-family carbohydrate kinase [Spirochaetales bacterium]|nr:FGGY-family carbohydrate kinase [Spirochaetales bacterium]
MYCGIDVGTSSVKCLITDASGSRLGLGKAPVGLHLGDRGFEADPMEWLRATAIAYAEAATGIGEATLAAGLAAVAVSGNGPTLVTVGGDGLPIGRAASWLERGAVAEAERVSALAGRRVDPSFYLPKALRAIESPQGDDVAMFFSGPEYLAFALGAAPVSYLADDYYDAFVWDRAVAARLGLADSLFPRYIRPATVIGSVSRQAAEAVGLPAGLPIVAGFPDFLAALVGSGAVETGLACDRSGSSEALNVCADRPFPDRAIFSLPHAVSGLWNLSGGLSTSGTAVEWFARASGYSTGGVSGYDGNEALFLDAERSNGDVPIFLPYLSGERAPLWEPGLRGAFIGLSLDHGRKEMARAVVESIAFGLRLAADRIRGGGFDIRLARCSGGAARDASLCAIKADVLGLPVEVPASPECEAMGDACACAVALGERSSLAEASASMVAVGARYEPDPRRAAAYDERYERWERALDAVLSMSAERAPKEKR